MWLSQNSPQIGSSCLETTFTTTSAPSNAYPRLGGPTASSKCTPPRPFPAPAQRSSVITITWTGSTGQRVNLYTQNRQTLGGTFRQNGTVKISGTSQPSSSSTQTRAPSTAQDSVSPITNRVAFISTTPKRQRSGGGSASNSPQLAENSPASLDTTPFSPTECTETIPTSSQHSLHS